MSASTSSPLISPLATNTILYCQNWQATVASYRDFLKLEVTHASAWFVEFRLAGHSHLSIADERRATVKSAHGAGITLTLQVADIETVWQALHTAALTTASTNTVPINLGPIKNHAWAARVFYLFDPEGHRIEIWSPNPINTNE